MKNLKSKGNNVFRALMWGCTFLVPQMIFAQATDTGHVYDANHLLAYTAAGFLIGVLILFFLSFIYHYREQDAAARNRSQYLRLSLVLQTGHLKLWLYDVGKRHYIELTETRGQGAEYDPIDFARFFNRDDFESLRKGIFDLCDKRSLSSSASLRSAAEGDEPVHYYEFSVTVAARDAQGRPVTLLCVQHDVTSEVTRKETVNQTLMRYHTVFNSSLVDMLYYDKQGVLRDINERACQAFNVPNREYVLNGSFLLENNPMYNGIPLDKLENTRTSTIINFRDFQDDVYRLDDFRLSGKMYYESTINPIRDEHGRLEGVYMAGRNVTEMVESFHRQQETIRQLREATNSIQKYVDNINYALQVSGVLLVNYNPSTYTLEVSNDINRSQLRMSQLRCIRLGTPRFRRQISSALNRMDHLTTRPIELNVETELRDKKGRQLWLLFSMVPLKDEQGRVVRYFGLCRNMTDMVETEQRLAVETKKAQETEELKQSFLTNMSYEIRTPLNTVVGFAELFETEHDEADEPLFVEEIKRNSNSLLQLVNDILFLSRLDAHMIEYNKTPFDFALVFDSHCQMGWSGVKPTVKTIIENPYEHLVVNIDQEQLGKVIEKLCANAVTYTDEGTIRAKYEYRHGELTFSIEDTGAGIDEATLPHVFDRFARNGQQKLCGTGLDLPIVQTLVQQMGGTIEIQSELGKGSTAWVIIPCEAQTIEKRRDMLL